MPVQDMKYCEYFDIDETYVPCIDESAINKGTAKWESTYPHDTFIELLDKTEKMLSGKTNQSIWIHGAYGTGKSQCAYAVKRILEVSDDEVKEYWDKYEPLKSNKVLLNKLLGYKAQGIITAYRYASGSINTSQQLFFAIQESIKKALIDNNIKYMGENSLKESAISWLNDPIHNEFIDRLLTKPVWASTFSQSTANEIINSLKKNSDVTSLMNDIFTLAVEEGITALDLTADSLCKWIIDIIEKNNIKLVFFWDEFSDYFRKNNTALGDFQKIVSICQEAPFYLVIVTHPLSSLAKNYDSKDPTNPWTVVQQRFDKVEITLPDNIAFDLIGHAFSVLPAARDNWTKMTDDLNQSVVDARTAVSKAANITGKNVMRDILPIHPMAALVLKNIASAFQSNQRSMFDFIKTPKDMEVHAFQWFIQNTGPLSDRPFLTIDMLWDFFYEKGKDYLTPDIKLILDTFPQQTQLQEKEKIVLKTILILQAIDQRLGGSLPILKPTDQNLSYAFEGDTGELETGCKGIAKGLYTKGILIENPIGDGKKAYSTAILAGDSAKIEESILFETFLTALKECIDSKAKFDGYIVEKTLETIPKAYQKRSIVLFLQLFEFDNNFGKNNIVVHKYIKAIKDEDNESTIFDALADRLLVAKRQSLFKAQHGIFDDYPLAIIEQWLNKDRTIRPVLLAYHLSMPNLDKPEFSELTYYMLTEYQDSDKVYEKFWLGNYNLVTISPKRIYDNQSKWHELTDKYINSKCRRIKQWAIDKRREIDQICDQYIRSEETYKRLS